MTRPTNPFEAPDAVFVVLAVGPVGEHRHHSLWPASLDVPSGWTVVYGPAPRAEAVDHVTRLGAGQ